METHLGWASHELGKQVGEMIDHFYSEDSIKARLSRIFNDPELDRQVDGLSFEELREVWDKNYKNGIYMATPVFDGAAEEEVRRCLQEAGIPIGGQARLRDGRSGEEFDRDVTVGVMYMMKLHLMLLAATPLGHFIERNPTIKMLALAFILLVGVYLIADGFELHIPKGYVYGAMGFSAMVEVLNLWARRRAQRRLLPE